MPGKSFIEDRLWYTYQTVIPAIFCENTKQSNSWTSQLIYWLSHFSFHTLALAFINFHTFSPLMYLGSIAGPLKVKLRLYRLWYFHVIENLSRFANIRVIVSLEFKYCHVFPPYRNTDFFIWLIFFMIPKSSFQRAFKAKEVSFSSVVIPLAFLKTNFFPNLAIIPIILLSIIESN